MFFKPIMSEEKQAWRSVDIPEEVVAEAEELMKVRHEGRMKKVPLGLFIGDLLRESFEREESQKQSESILEDYAVESDCVYIRDNARDVVAELRFKDGSDLYCNIDSAKNCVHVGFAWSIPKVNLLIAKRKTAAEKGNI